MKHDDWEQRLDNLLAEKYGESRKHLDIVYALLDQAVGQLALAEEKCEITIVQCDIMMNPISNIMGLLEDIDT